MQKVLTAAQMREVDRLTTDRYGIPSILLMENAAHAVARVITEKLGGSVEGKSILILCGPGNNGGDGAALARILGLAGAYVRVLLFAKISETMGDARINFGVLCREDFTYDDVYFSNFGELIEVGSKEEWVDYYMQQGQFSDVIVDALFGTGLSRPLDIWLGNVVHDINFTAEGPLPQPRLTVSVDLPSGLDADLGHPIGEAVRADVTVTFTAPMAANVLPRVSHLNGELFVCDIGSPFSLIEDLPSQLLLADSDDAATWLKKTEFANDSYKNKRGHTMIVAGSGGYSGAAVLAGNAAMRSGVGLVTLACPAGVKTEIASRLLAEVILSTVESDEFAGHLGKADAIAVGCGLDAEDPEIGGLVREMVLGREVPVIVDAGALSVLSPFDGEANWPPAHTGGSDLSQKPLILTPHEGEFLRLLGTDDKDAIKDRVAAVREFSQTNNVILVLKGERVLIGHPDGRVVVNPTGNSGLGKAGNGDTLTGILAGFVAQAFKMNIDIFETVVAAVYVAGMAGDVAEKKYGKRVMTASDVRECLVDVFDSLSDDNPADLMPIHV